MQCINEREQTIWQFAIVRNKLMSVINASVMLLTMNFVNNIVKVVCKSTQLSPHGSTATVYFHNVMTKFMINNRTDSWKSRADCRLQTADYRLQTTDYRLQTAYSGPQTVDYKRPWLTAGRKSWRPQSLVLHNPCRFEIMTLWPNERQL